MSFLLPTYDPLIVTILMTDSKTGALWNGLELAECFLLGRHLDCSYFK